LKMKDLKRQTRDVSFILFGIAAVLILLSQTGCGKQGPMGATGATGLQGAPGTDCTVTSVSANLAAPNGGSLISCQDGSQSLVLNGTSGINGTNGNAGATGQAGTNGTNGTIIVAVQFCPGTPTYPSTFLEVGFCINNTLYAVYSANDGFLTEVTPGEYSSDGINASCNFTVAANCVVTH
jgi:hypothetical protein